MDRIVKGLPQIKTARRRIITGSRAQLQHRITGH
jgi:hypothetical protein